MLGASASQLLGVLAIIILTKEASPCGPPLGSCGPPLGPCGPPLGPCGPTLGSCGPLGPCGAPLGSCGPPLGPCGWAPLRPLWAAIGPLSPLGLGPLWAPIDRLWAPLGRLWALGPLWAPLGPCGLPYGPCGPPLGPCGPPWAFWSQPEPNRGRPKVSGGGAPHGGLGFHIRPQGHAPPYILEIYIYIYIYSIHVFTSYLHYMPRFHISAAFEGLWQQRPTLRALDVCIAHGCELDVYERLRTTAKREKYDR